MSNFDEALERFHVVDFEYAGGLANHGPMAAQALVDLGHPALIPAFVDRYAPRLPPARSGRELSAAEQTAALGRYEHAADWVATYEQALASVEAVDWRAWLRARVPVLLPGLFAAAGHGLLRTVHAIRALEREDSGLRRRELARGLAYWSARYAPFSDAARSAEGKGSDDGELAAWLESVPSLAWPLALGESFDDAARRLPSLPGFVDALARAPRSAPDAALEVVDARLSALVRLSARLYVSRPAARIAFAHAITVPAAARTLARQLAPGDAAALENATLKAVATFVALAGGAPVEDAHDAEVEQTAKSWDEIRYRAACSIEEHAIKVAEACYREDRGAPDPVLRRAAADAALRIDGGKSGLRC